MLPDTFFPNAEDRRDKRVVLKHLIRRPSILRAAIDELARIRYFQAYPDLACLFDTLYRYYKEYQKPPSFDILWMEFHATKSRLRLPFTDSDMETIRAAILSWFNEVEFDDKYVQTIISDELEVHDVEAASALLEANDDTTIIKDGLLKVTTRLKRNLFSGLAEETAWDNPEDHIKEILRDRLGCEFIDRALDGGLACRESMLFMAPSGGGKTTMAIQVEGAQIEASRHVLHYSTEQPLTGDLAIRQYVVGTHTKRSYFKKGWVHVPEDVKAHVDRIKPKWKQYYHFVDCRPTTRHIETIDDLLEPLDRLIQEGKRPHLCVLDWWGRLKQMLLRSTKLSDAGARTASANWLGDLIAGIQKRDTRLLVLHQVAGHATKKGPKAALTTKDSQEDSNLDNLFEFAFILGKLDSDNRAKISCDKARSNGKTQGMLQLFGDECRFATLDPMTMEAGDVPEEAMKQKAEIYAESDT